MVRYEFVNYFKLSIEYLELFCCLLGPLVLSCRDVAGRTWMNFGKFSRELARLPGAFSTSSREHLHAEEAKDVSRELDPRSDLQDLGSNGMELEEIS